MRTIFTAVDLDYNGILIALISSASVIIVAMLGYLGVKVTVSARKAEAAGTEAVKAATRVDDKLSTGNGKDIGETVHDMAQMQEVLSGQLHTNTSELLQLRDQVTEHSEKLNEHLEHVARREKANDSFFTEVRKFMKGHEHGPG